MLRLPIRASCLPAPIYMQLYGSLLPIFVNIPSCKWTTRTEQ